MEFENNPVIKEITNRGFEAIYDEREKASPCGVDVNAKKIFFTKEYLNYPIDRQKVILEHEFGHVSFNHPPGVGHNRRDKQEFEADLYAAIKCGKESVLEMLNFLQERHEGKYQGKSDKFSTELKLMVGSELKRRKNFIENVKISSQKIDENITITTIENYEDISVLKQLKNGEFLAKPEFYESFTKEEIKRLCKGESDILQEKLNAVDTKPIEYEYKVELENLFEIEFGRYYVHYTNDERVNSQFPVIDNERKIVISDKFLDHFKTDKQREVMITREVAKHQFGFLKDEILSKEEQEILLDKMFEYKADCYMTFNEKDILETVKLEKAYLKSQKIKGFPINEASLKNAENMQSRLESEKTDEISL